MKIKKLYDILLILLILLFATSFLLTRHIDSVLLPDSKLYPLFYAISLPLTLWVMLPIGAFLTLFSQKSLHRIVSILLIAFSVEFLPSFILVNPWLPDQYPYLSEAYWIYLYGKIHSVHYLSEVPALGLLYGTYQIVVNIDPFSLSKLFSLFQALIIPIFLMILSRNLYGKESLLPMLFLSFNYFDQINVFHRASLHFTYALLFINLIFWILKKRVNEINWKNLLLLTFLVFSAMVLAYPGSGFILTLMAVTYILLTIIDYEKIKALSTPLIAFISIFGVWYFYVSWSEIRIAGSIWNSLMKILKLDIAFAESAGHPFASGLTSEFQAIVYSRLVIEGSVILIGLAIALINYALVLIRRFKGKCNCNTVYIYSFTIASFASTAPWLLTEWSRWAFYKFSGYFLTFSLLSLVSYFFKHRKTYTLIKALVYTAVIIALILVPLLRYASIPYLHVTTEELYSVTFVHKYYEFTSNVYYLEYPPYILPRLVSLGDVDHEISSFYWFDDPPSKGVYILTMRALTRDGFYTYPEPLWYRLEYLENYMNTFKERIYDNEFNRVYYLNG